MINDIKERPILFSGPMVRAILDGRKTQTRRIVTDESLISIRADGIPGKVQPRSRYGAPGDRLWVRETWAPCAGGVIYRADAKDALCAGIAAEHDSDTGRWHPSIYMRRMHSRIDLEITAVQVERLQDISPFDALAEGCPHHHKTGFSPEDAVEWYSDLWESINGPGSWAANPWVWVVVFKHILS